MCVFVFLIHVMFIHCMFPNDQPINHRLLSFGHNPTISEKQLWQSSPDSISGNLGECPQNLIFAASSSCLDVVNLCATTQTSVSEKTRIRKTREKLQSALIDLILWRKYLSGCESMKLKWNCTSRSCKHLSNDVNTAGNTRETPKMGFMLILWIFGLPNINFLSQNRNWNTRYEDNCTFAWYT